MIMKFEDFNKWDFKYAFEINSEFDVYKDTREDVTVITVENFFKYPRDVVEALKSFPVNDRDKFYEEVQSKQFILRPPGYQQILPASYFEGVSLILYKLLVEYDFVPNDYESSNEYDKLSEQISQYVYYTNIFYPGMKNVMNNFMPHFDQSAFAYNIFLSEEEVGGGTSFYNLKYKGEKYPTVNSLGSITEHDDRVELRDMLNAMHEMDDSSPENYSTVPKDNNLFEKYYTVPYEFNKLVLYKGSFWHNADYDASKESNLRYSLSATYTPNDEDQDRD